ncbi:MAG: glycoside hydrolase domain-containing protein [Opitutales bacterium]
MNAYSLLETAFQLATKLRSPNVSFHMMHFLRSLPCVLLCLLVPAFVGLSAAVEKTPIDWVDPFIGTAGDHGQLYPGATVPFGLVKLSPDTGSNHAGYRYEDPAILGFSHTRIGGVGCKGAGGTLKLQPAPTKTVRQSYAKASEAAHPGFYGVRFDSGVEVELTVDPYIGYHRYRFPEDRAFIHVDPGHNYGGGVRHKLQIDGDRRLSGLVVGKNVCRHKYYQLYYAVEFSRAFVQSPSAEPGSEALWLEFPLADGPRTVEVRVALSPISVEQAYAELAAARGQDFEAVKGSASAQWSALLDKYELSAGVPAGMDDQATLFYTALYRSHLFPHRVTSSAGTYRLAGDKDSVRRTEDIAPDYVNYSGWSTWDDFRKFALFSLMEPGISRNIVRSIAEWFQAGKTPDWADGYWPGPSVRNEFMSAILLDAYVKGIGGFDLAATYASGIPVHGNKQVEQAYGYFIKYRMAEALGKTEEAEKWREKALGYRNYWNTAQVDADGTVRGFITPDGQPFPRDRVDEVDAGFYEGNLWHYRLFNSYDMGGLSQLRGSTAELVKDLEHYFETWQHMALNEPPLAYPFLFVYLGRPDLTQKWSRRYTTEPVTSRYHNHGLFKRPVIRPVYQASPDGFLPTMDDDTGAMSSQYVYQALGLYPVVMGEPYWVIGSPIFPEVTLHLAEGGRFVIRANRVSAENFYIQSATLNGAPYRRAWIEHGAIRDGGVLEFEMGPEPSSWASAPEQAPPSLTPY